MGTIVAVHGAGVRNPGIDQLERDLRNGAKGQPELAGMSVVMCRWGEHVGASPARVDDTLPPPIVARAIALVPDDEALEAARWSLLFDDPLFELRIVAAGAEGAGVGAGGPVIGAALPSQAASDAVAALITEMDQPPAVTGISRPEFVAAVAAVGGSKELAGAATVAGPVSDAEFGPAVARAIVAQLIARHRADAPGTMPALVVNGMIRDEFVVLLAGRLAPVTTKGLVPNWLKDRITGFLASRATALAADRRAAVQEASSLVLADILHYLRRGEEMVDYVAQCLKSVQGPVVALGHSLGGIMLVDLLARASHPPVDLLVTVGSQAPILYAYDALERPRESARDAVGPPYAKDHPPFTPWLNIYNRNDFVSFLARPIFEGELDESGLDIIDQELHLPEAFPAAHGAYWTDESTFQFIATRVGALPAFQVHQP
jgi:hypothetical protein